MKPKRYQTVHYYKQTCSLASCGNFEHVHKSSISYTFLYWY
nr:MAG TPA: hypothetical protein [Caudoviricetes sp.]